MIRVGLLLTLAGSMGLLSLPSGAHAGDPKKAAAAVIAIERGGGFVDPDQSPFAHYWFTMAKDGAWELKPLRGESRRGKLGTDAVRKWVKEIEDGGFHKLKSNPSLGAADEPYMDITLQVEGKKEQKRIRLEEKLAQAIEKKAFELAKVGKQAARRGSSSSLGRGPPNQVVVSRMENCRPGDVSNPCCGTEVEQQVSQRSLASRAALRFRPAEGVAGGCHAIAL